MASRPRPLPCLLGLLLACTAPARAEIAFGRFGTVADPDIIRIFADGAQGDVSPLRTLGGPATLLASAADLVYDPTESVLYVSDFSSHAIRAFAGSARGNVAPLRSFAGPAMGSPRDLLVLPGVDEIVAVAFAPTRSLVTYARHATGNATALRQLAGALTQLDNPGGFAYRSATDELYLAEHTPLPTMTGQILVFPRTADGNVPPSRVIAGPSTQLGTLVSSVAAHPTLPEVYALVGTADAGFTAGSIVTFAASADGDATPLRVIAGSQTLLRNNFGFEYDSRTDEFVVLTNVYGSGTPGLLFFPRTATGDVAPSRVISGANTGLGESYGPLAASLDLIFYDGFDPAGP